MYHIEKCVCCSHGIIEKIHEFQELSEPNVLIRTKSGTYTESRETKHEAKRHTNIISNGWAEQMLHINRVKNPWWCWNIHTINTVFCHLCPLCTNCILKGRQPTNIIHIDLIIVRIVLQHTTGHCELWTTKNKL